MLKSKKVWLGALIVFLVILGIVVAIRVFTPEDDWACTKGEWVRHGNPTADQPETPCASN